MICLGYVLDKDDLRRDLAKIKSVMNYTAPENLKQLQRFLGMVGWYARFIEKDSQLKLALLRFLQKGRKWKWGEEQDKAFQALKQKLISAPVLARPDFTKPFI